MSKPRLYFAHPVFDYNSPREAVALMAIEGQFPEHEIVNPGTPEHQQAYEERGDFSYWLDMAASCDALVFMAMPGHDKRIGAGVGAEIQTAIFGREVPHGRMPGNKPVYEIDRLTFEIKWCLPPHERVLTLEETKLVVPMLKALRLEWCR